MSSASFAPATPSTPHPRLISKMAVVAWYPEGGRSTGHDVPDGVVVNLFCKVNIKKGGYTRHLLFPDENITLLSTSAYPLESPQNALLLNPPPPLSIQEAAQHLNIPTTIQPSPSPSTSSKILGRSQKVKIAIQDFSVCLISEGGETKGDLSKSVGRPIEGGTNEEVSKAWLIMLELMVPLKSRPPLDRYSLSIPLPRCLSNTLSFQLQGSSSTTTTEETNTAYSFLTTPRLLPGPSSSKAGIEKTDRVLEGTFQSTTSLEIRWAPQQMVSNESSGNISVGGAARPIALRDTQQKTVYNVLGEDREDGLVKVRVGWEMTGEVHYSGVENTGHLDFSVDAPSGLIWDELPSLQTNRGLSSSSILVPQAPAEYHSTEDSSQQDNSLLNSPMLVPHSPTPPSSKLLMPNSSALKTSHSRKGSGEPSSHPSLLRQLPPSSVDLGDGVDASFSAFDTSLRPSPSSSPAAKHRSPLGDMPSYLSPASPEPSNEHQAKMFRLNLDISQIHASRELFVVNASGTVLLKPSTTGEITLPEFTIETDWSGSEAGSRTREWLIQAPKQAKVYPPPIVERLHDRREGKAWGMPSSVDFETSYPFVVGLPVPISNNSIPETNLSMGLTTISPVRAIRRRSSLFVRQPSPPLEAFASGSEDTQPSSNESLIPTVESRSIISVHLDTFLSIGSVQEGEPQLWSQLSKMKVLLSPSTPPTSMHEEDAFFEFGIIAGPSASSTLTASPSVRIVSVHVDGVSLPFTLQKDLASDSNSDLVVGALGYVRVELDEDTREVGGKLEVLYVVSELGSSKDESQISKRGGWLSWDRKPSRTETIGGFHLGLPSFENEVQWEETTIHIMDEYSLSVDARSSSVSFTDSRESKNVVHSIVHSLPALATPYLFVIPLSNSLLASKSTPNSVKPTWSWSRMPFLLLTFWILFSIGSEIRTLRSGMIEMAVEMRGRNEIIQRALEQCEIGYQKPIPAWQAPSTPPSPPPVVPLTSSEYLSSVSTTRGATSFATPLSSSSSSSEAISSVPFDRTSSVAWHSPPLFSNQDYTHTRLSAESPPLRPKFVDVPLPNFRPPPPSSTHGPGGLSPTTSYSFTTLDQFLAYTKQLINRNILVGRWHALRKYVGRVLSRITGE